MDDRSDHEFEQERHRRRLMLMRMQGDVIRQERRMLRLWVFVITLAVLALLLASI